MDDQARDDLKELDDYRVAARTLLRDEHLTEPIRQRALLRLVRRAQGEARLPDQCVRAVEAEVALDFDRRFAEPSEASSLDPYRRAHLALRTEGYSSCPTCHSRLATREELDRESAAMRAEAERLRRAEDAIHE
ncbi:MAG: hypothetical protein WD556_03255 [Actinomycetota bacterium]